jgi:protease YdgD
MLTPGHAPPRVVNLEEVKDDWAIIVLKDRLSVRPVSVRSLNVSQLESAAPFVHVGYGSDRPFLPSIMRNCKVDGYDDQTLVHRCLTYSGHSGAPILAQLDGTYSVLGISIMSLDVAEGYACPAVQFEEAIAKISK